MKKIIFTLIASLTLMGCNPPPSTTQPAATTIVPPEQNQKFVDDVKLAQLALEGIGKLALQYAVSDADRTGIAELMSGSGHVFESFEDGTIPTSEQIQNSFNNYFPTTSSKYMPIASGSAVILSAAILKIKEYVPQNNATMTAAYFNYICKALAQTDYAVADPFLTQS
jgi:hypothetical protein